MNEFATQKRLAPELVEIDSHHEGQRIDNFLTTYLKDVFSTIHILPFYPFSSDDGFSVTDFFSVDPHLGNWEDVDDLTNHFNLMADFVLNHVSS